MHVQETASSFAISAEDDLEDDLEKGVEEFEARLDETQNR